MAILFTQLPLILFAGAKYDVIFGFNRIDSGLTVIIFLSLFAPIFNLSWLIVEVIRMVKGSRQAGAGLRFWMPLLSMICLIESIAIVYYIALHARM